MLVHTGGRRLWNEQVSNMRWNASHIAYEWRPSGKEHVLPAQQSPAFHLSNGLYASHNTPEKKWSPLWTGTGGLQVWLGFPLLTSKPLFGLPLRLCEMGKCGSLERPSAGEEGMTEP